MPKYVLMRLIRILSPDSKKQSPPPKATQELCAIMCKIIDLATLKHIPVLEVLNFAKDNIKNTNLSIKSGGQEVLKRIYVNVGADTMNNYVKDLPATILGTL